MLKKLVLLFLVVIVSSCTNQVNNKNYSITEKKQDKGLVVFSITQTGEMQDLVLKKIPFSQFYIYKRTDRPDKKDSQLAHHQVRFTSFKGINSKDADFKGVAGKLQMLELGPGKYKFDAYSISAEGYTITWDYFEYHFSVNAGAITYIGNLNADIRSKKQSFLSSLTGPNYTAAITLDDQYARDMQVFKKRFSNLADEEVTNFYDMNKFVHKEKEKK